MCVIIANQGTGAKNPTREEIEACELWNGDGAGFAWLEHGAVQWEKGIDAERVIDLMDMVKGPWVAHFRIATAGGVSTEMCHPFPIDSEAPTWPEGECDQLLFHNGTVSGWKEMARKVALRDGVEIPSGPWSDSRAVAWVAASAGVEILNFIDGRFAVLEHTEEEDPLTLFGDWKQRKGIWYSNLSWTAALPEHKGKKKSSLGYPLYGNARSLTSVTQSNTGSRGKKKGKKKGGK